MASRTTAQHGLDEVCPQFLIIAVIGAAFLALAVLRFRQVTAQSA